MKLMANDVEDQELSHMCAGQYSPLQIHKTRRGHGISDFGTRMGVCGRKAPFFPLAEPWLHSVRQCSLLSASLENPFPDFSASLAARVSHVTQF